MSETAITIGLLALVAIIGLWIGQCKIRGIGLGIGDVLFGGIIVAHFTNQYGDVLHMVGRIDVLNNTISVIGNAQQKLLQVQTLPYVKLVLYYFFLLWD